MTYVVDRHRSDGDKPAARLGTPVLPGNYPYHLGVFHPKSPSLTELVLSSSVGTMPGW